MSKELKPCPFCGGEAYIVPGAYRDGGYIENFAHVKCTKCGANGDTFSECLPFDVVERMAEDAWNRRAERTCRWEHIEGTLFVTECGETYGRVVPDNFCPHCGAKVVCEL